MAGLVSQLDRFAKLDLVDWTDIVIGGHEIRDTSAYRQAAELAAISHAIESHLVESARPTLDEVDANVRPGILNNVGPTIQNLADDVDPVRIALAGVICGLPCLFSSVGQARTAAACIKSINNGQMETGQALLATGIPELYALTGLAAAFLVMA